MAEFLVIVYHPFSSFRLESEQVAKELSIPLFHTSVKTDRNVVGIFHSLASSYVNKIKDTVEVEQVSLSAKQFFHLFLLPDGRSPNNHRLYRSQRWKKQNAGQIFLCSSIVFKQLSSGLCGSYSFCTFINVQRLVYTVYQSITCLHIKS